VRKKEKQTLRKKENQRWDRKRKINMIDRHTHKENKMKKRDEQTEKSE
jgi:hypothetical protein